MSTYWFLALYLLIGLVVAVFTTKRSWDGGKGVDMSEVAFLPVMFWPAFVVAMTFEFVVRRIAGVRE